MAFGLSFGSKKQKSSTNSTLTKQEDTTQNKTGTQSTTGTVSNEQSASGSSSTQSNQATSQSTTGQSTGQTSGQSQQQTQSFSDQTLGGLESAVSQLFGSTVGQQTQVGDFNPIDFVSKGLEAARAQAQAPLEDQLNQLVSGIGGNANSNSAVALLSNRLRNDTAANLSGVEANLTAQANDIVRQNLLAGSQIDATNQSFLVNLLSALKGGITASTGTESQQTAQQTQQDTAGTTVGSENTQQQQQSTSVETQNLLTAISELLSGSTNTVGTENTTTKGKSSGGGLSLSL